MIICIYTLTLDSILSRYVYTKSNLLCHMHMPWILLHPLQAAYDKCDIYPTCCNLDFNLYFTENILLDRLPMSPSVFSELFQFYC